MTLFLLGLFSAVGRWLRMFRVRPLKLYLAVQIPDGFLKIVDDVCPRFPSSPADVLDGVPKVKIQFPGLDNLDRLVRPVPAVVRRMVHCFHGFHSRPARARRQGPSVLERTGKRQIMRLAHV